MNLDASPVAQRYMHSARRAARAPAGRRRGLLSGEGQDTELRGIAVDAAGTFAEAVWNEAFHPYFADVMTQAFDGIKSGNAR